ncbi:unnamed protein product [Heterosigma akashiwo]
MHEMFLHEIPEEIPMDERSQLIHAGKPGLCAPKDAKYWHYQLWKANQKVDALSADQRTYPVGEVYCIFSTEEGQRQCLNALTTGKIPAMFEIGDKPKEHRFRGTNVLEVEEPVEPSEVIWQNLEISGFTFFVQGVVTALLTLAVIAACYYVIVQLKESGSTKSTGVVVSLINAVLPMVLKAIVMFEKHVDDGDRQDSLFAKLTAARFMNTAIINWVVTSFSNTLSETSLKTIMSILVADAFITPTIQLLNVMGNLKMHVLSKLAKTQPKLLSYFTGAQWYLGERYTSHTKTFFVAIFYAALFPAGMFVAALCFAYGYWVDKGRRLPPVPAAARVEEAPAVRRPVGRAGPGAHRAGRPRPRARHRQLVLRLALRLGHGGGGRDVREGGQDGHHPGQPPHLVQVLQQRRRELARGGPGGAGGALPHGRPGPSGHPRGGIFCG